MIALILGLQAMGAETSRNSPVLRRALELADLNNWPEAEPEFAKAAAAFRANRDQTGLDYAELGVIRTTIQRRNLALTSAQLDHRLESDPLVKTDRDLRIFCLAIKGEIDGEMGRRRDAKRLGGSCPDRTRFIRPPLAVSRLGGIGPGGIL